MSGHMKKNIKIMEQFFKMSPTHQQIDLLNFRLSVRTIYTDDKNE